MRFDIGCLSSGPKHSRHRERDDPMSVHWRNRQSRWCAHALLPLTDHCQTMVRPSHPVLLLWTVQKVHVGSQPTISTTPIPVHRPRRKDLSSSCLILVSRCFKNSGIRKTYITSSLRSDVPDPPCHVGNSFVIKLSQEPERLQNSNIDLYITF